MRWLVGIAIVLLVVLEVADRVLPKPSKALMASDGRVVASCGSVLEKAGTYVLAQDCSGKGPWLFDIQADNVSLDFAGHTLRCESDNPSTSTMTGIKAVYAQQFRVSNGTITGCHTALDAGHGRAVTAANLHISGNTHIGLNLGGSDNQVLDSRFENIGNATAGASAIAILGPGARSIVAGNTITNVGRQKAAEPPNAADGIGILVSGTSTDVLILNNTITLDAPNAKDVPIWVVGGASVFLSGNNIRGYQREIGSGKGAQINFVDLGPRDPR